MHNVENRRPIRSLIDERAPFEPEMVLVEAGAFVMGSDPEVDPSAYPEELPQHTLYLPEYAIGRTPVTNAQYERFLRATRHDPPRHWRFLRFKRRRAPFRRGEYPVVNVSWHDARAYCAWLSEATGKPYRLPTEAEWEKAARGIDGRIYPWGNEWDPALCHTSESAEEEAAVAVDLHPGGASPYGLLDAVGNVWEWTTSLWGEELDDPAFKYPYDPADGRENWAAPRYVRRVLRGVSFYNDRSFARCAARYRYSPYNNFGSVGFRVALSYRSAMTSTGA
jgi:formylglycine-generating enzyme required for sulfatase activity